MSWEINWELSIEKGVHYGVECGPEFGIEWGVEKGVDWGYELREWGKRYISVYLLAVSMPVGVMLGLCALLGGK